MYLCLYLTVPPACRTLENAKKLSEGVKLSTPISLDVSDEKALDAEVAKHDLVIRYESHRFHEKPPPLTSRPV